VKWVYRPLAGDNTCDFDFGASANIMDLAGERYIGLGSKDGSYYVLKPVPKDAKGEVVWSTNVVFGGQAGGFIASSAFDGKRVYGGTALGDAIGPEAGAACDPTDPRDTSLQDPSFHAFDATTGAIAWQKDKNYTFAPTTVVNDVVFIGVGNALAPEVRAYDAATGAQLTRLKSQGGVNSAVAAWDKFLYFGAGNSFDSTGSAIYAYALP
jgi:outer membrane protein assembly factor BamB